MARAYQPIGYCPACGYRLDAGLCPECGGQVVRPAPRDPRRWAARAPRLALRLAATGVAVCLVLAGVNAAAYRWWPIASLEGLLQGKGRVANWAYEIREWRLDREDERAAARWRRIHRELAGQVRQAWDGEYCNTYGGSLSYDDSLRFAVAESGYVEVPLSGGCGFGADLPMRSFANHGDVVRSTDQSLFVRESTPHFATSSHPPQELEFVRIRWGKRHYLIERSNLESTRAEGPQSLYVQSALFLFRRDDLLYPVDGLPEYPPEYRDLLPPPPIRLTIRDTWVEELPSEYEGSRLLRVCSVVTRPGLEELLEPETGVLAMFADLPLATAVQVCGDEALIEYEQYLYGNDKLIPPQLGWAFGLEQEAVAAMDEDVAQGPD